MPDSPILPSQRAWSDRSGNPLPVEFFKFFRDLLRFVQQAGGNSVDISAILARLDALEAAGNATIQGLASVLVQGSLADGNVQLLLDGDEASPDASSYYGTDDVGAKGFHPVPDNTVPYLIPDGEAYTVRENKQAPFSIPIDIGLGSALIVEGILVEVD